MVDMLIKIMTNVLEALYRPFGFAVIMTVTFMFLYLYAKENGWKTVIRRWMEAFKGDSQFRKVLFLVFYTTMILFRTLINRDLWLNPLTDIKGVWGLYNSKGEFTTEVIENLMLFIPFAILLLWSFHEKILGEKNRLGRAIWQSTKNVFVFSLCIETLQLLMRLGDFQLSDLFYNTLGGFVGGLIYWCGYKIFHRKISKGKK